MEHARPPSELNLDGSLISRANAWSRWRQQFILFLKASGTHKEASSLKASLLVDLIGAEGFDIYQTFSFSDEKQRDDVDAVLDKFDKYFGAKPNVTLARYKFFTRKQELGESIDQYITALRLLSKKCEFLTLEDSLLKDRIVCGISSTVVRDRLLRTEDLNLERALKICQAHQISSDGERQLGLGMSSAGLDVHVDVVRASSNEDERGPRGGWRGGGGGARPGASTARGQYICKGCGGYPCSGDRCPAKYVKCFNCNYSGHFARVCQSKSKEFMKVHGIQYTEDAYSGIEDSESFYIS